MLCANALLHVDAIFFYYYADYAGGKGTIEWIEDKPVITGRYKLWGGFETPASIAEKINKLPGDIYSQEGYSLIPVHNWSNGVDEILECVGLLRENVRIVTPDELVALVKANVNH